MKIRSRAARLRLAMRPTIPLLLLSVAAPLWAGTLAGNGDFGVYIDLYSQPADGGLSRLLLVAQFPADELSWREEDGLLRARLHCAWSLHALGEAQAAVSEDLVFERSIEGGGLGMLYLRSQELPSGEYRLELRCEDRGRKVGGLLGFHDRHPASVLSERVVLRDFREGGTLGDLLLHTVSEGAPAEALSRLNAGGLFYEGESAMELSTEFVPPRELPEDAYFGLTLRVLDRGGVVRFKKQGGWKYGRERVPLRFQLPLAGLSAGDYRVGLILHGPGLAHTSFERNISILSNSTPDHEVLARRRIEAQLFLDSQDFAKWQSLPFRERDAMLDRFWSRHDANPSTAENEVYEEFLRRFALAQSRYTVFSAGALSHRGRMLIRYGEPEEIESEVMPLNRSELGNAIRDLHGEEVVEPGISPWATDASDSEGRVDRSSDLNRDLGRIGTGTSPSFGQDSEAFEVWSYEFGGKPLLPDFQLQLAGISLKVIFADRQGYGDYELVYRSEDFDF